MKIGLLPLYIKLYDDVVPQTRERLDPFYDKIAELIEKNGIEVVTSPFCRVKPEFETAVALFEKEKVDAIVTLHMAYSPSLEAIDALCATDLPVIVLDTTETLEFGNMQDAGEIMYNHGIHGVMDLCSMMTRRGKPYAIAAGHYAESDVIDRVCGFVRAAVAAKALFGSKVGLIGGAFEGMGDFAVSYDELKEKFGIEVAAMDPAKMRAVYDALTDAEVAAEKNANAAFFTLGDNIIEDEYDLAVRACLALRHYVKEYGINAYSVNFKNVGRDVSGIPTMPFLECCKAMANGTGYAGEGDALTAAFVGAFLQGYPEASFVEIFCPDWKNNLIFLSHMGEMNYRLATAKEKPEIRRVGTNYAPGSSFPYAGYARMKGAKGVYVNVSRDAKDYRITAAAAELIEFDKDNFAGNMRGWMRPVGMTTAEFLEGKSRVGATHHSVFVTSATVEQIVYFGKLLGIETTVLGK